jgi:hypothetical protein
MSTSLVSGLGAVSVDHPLSGFVLLRDTQPEEEELLVKQVQPKSM